MRDPQNPTPPSSADFRNAMGHFPTGVCVVALEADGGDIAAMTINSFVSVSLEPLLVCWSLHNDSGRFDLFARAGQFTISILNAEQGEQALAYASRGNSAVREGDFELNSEGLPVIRGALSTFQCRAHTTHLAGDHTMILGEVTALSGPADVGGKALGFYEGEFISLPQD
ncbi:flavin reductase family protein [uncultured Erythrobacter sp.]|uniref:flavin reductase family protein n=1 Tax=uncultured Erythrobacter sp. TaxID=263913 RepID=UPI00262EEB55|nr:flavin reductase family protein [uncultured Erythrobacter sp.]